MKIFFLCRTGHHTALIAAALHLNLISRSRNLRDAVKTLRGWNDIKPEDVGAPFYVGNDKDNNEIYTIGIDVDCSMMERVVNEIINLIGVDPRERKIINVSGAVTGWTKMGLVLKKLNFNTLAKILFNMGIQAELKRVNLIMRKKEIITC